MSDKKHSTPSKKKSISISGDVRDSNVFIGDNNTVNQTIIQKFFNIFKSDSETLEHRNRRILLGHVENAWIKGVLDASLHGAALLDLGIKQDPEAVTKYPWAIKKETTDETLPAGLSMLGIFDSIGMGRSLLILGAPGSGKTTMLLELARQLIQHAREDVTYPIPMVFNLASWTEKLTLTDWLAQELNNLYSVPRKTAPDWVKGDKLLLLLDGLDEVRQENRAKCVEAINAFRKEHGLTSLAVCSRSQDYADLNAKLSFEGAIEVQPLTQGQITEFFNHFGNEMAGLEQALEKDSALREMAETPLFLSIMIMAYRDKQDVDIWVSQDENIQRKHLFDTYIERMFERRLVYDTFKQRNVLHWLSWLGRSLIKHQQPAFFIDELQQYWLELDSQLFLYKFVLRSIYGILFGPILGLFFSSLFDLIGGERGQVIFLGLSFCLLVGVVSGIGVDRKKIKMIDVITWNWKRTRQGLGGCLMLGLLFCGICGILSGIPLYQFPTILTLALSCSLPFAIMLGLFLGLEERKLEQASYPSQRLFFTIRNFILVSLLYGLVFGLIIGYITGFLFSGLDATFANTFGLFVGSLAAVFFGLLIGLRYGGTALILHFSLRYILIKNNYLPIRLVPFLDHCVDLIFLRRVGGGYIFVHRLLMEHFAEMYVESPTSKGN